MSEIRTTRTITHIEAPPPEPVVSLAELLRQAGGLTSNRTAADILVASSTPALPAQSEATAATMTIQKAQELVEKSRSARHALAALASTMNLEIPKRASTALLERIQKCVSLDSRSAVTALAHDLMRNRQNQMQRTLYRLAREGCAAIGFETVSTPEAAGLLITRSKNGNQKIAVDVEKTADGGVRMHFDGDGFHGSACVEALNGLEQWLREHGVRCESAESVPKRRGGVWDARRVPVAIGGVQA